MRRICLIVFVLVGCATEVPVPAAPPAAGASSWPRPPVGLYGDWLAITPRSVRGETLSVRPDFTARGVIPWPGSPTGLGRIVRWKMKYLSADPSGDRGDWRQGHENGGELGCLREGSGCTSMPMLCLGAGEEYFCQKFVLAVADPDTLAMPGGLRYTRLSRHVPPSAPPMDSARAAPVN